MRFIRGFIVLIQMIIFALGALCIGLFIIPISAIFLKDYNHRRFCANVVHKSWKFFTIVMQKFGSIKVETNGDFQNIKGKVIVASHPSLIDIVLLIGLIPNSLCLAKKDLLKNPIMYKIVKCLPSFIKMSSRFARDAEDVVPYRLRYSTFCGRGWRPRQPSGDS